MGSSKQVVEPNNNELLSCLYKSFLEQTKYSDELKESISEDDFLNSKYEISLRNRKDKATTYMYVVISGVYDDSYEPISIRYEVSELEKNSVIHQAYEFYTSHNRNVRTYRPKKRYDSYIRLNA